MNEEKNQKFGLVEMVIVCFMFTIPLDIINIIIDGGTIDTSWILQFGEWLVFSLYFTIKGCPVTSSFAKRFLLPFAIMFLPDWLLPFQLTILFLVTAYYENHPEKFPILETVSITQKKPSLVKTGL